jgi:hypothetical protein
MNDSIKEITLYAAYFTAVRAILRVKNLYSQPTADGSPPELIQQMESCELKDGTPLHRIDEDTLETPTGQRLSRNKPQ